MNTLLSNDWLTPQRFPVVICICVMLGIALHEQWRLFCAHWCTGMSRLSASLSEVTNHLSTCLSQVVSQLCACRSQVMSQLSARPNQVTILTLHSVYQTKAISIIKDLFILSCLKPEANTSSKDGGITLITAIYLSWFLLPGRGCNDSGVVRRWWPAVEDCRVRLSDHS